MKKRNISLLLTGAMVLTLAAGATAHAELYEADYSEWIPEETVTLDVYDQLANYSGEQTGWFGQLMLERFNVKLNIIPESDGTYDTRMESGYLGDLENIYLINCQTVVALFSAIYAQQSACPSSLPVNPKSPMPAPNQPKSE